MNNHKPDFLLAHFKSYIDYLLYRLFQILSNSQSAVNCVK